MLKKLHWLAAPVLVAALALGLGAQPVQAADGYDRCPDGSFCIFGDANGQGRFAYFSCMSPDLSRIGSGIDNMTSSVWNRTSDTWKVYEGYNYSGTNGDVYAWAKGNLPGYQNDVISSLRRISLSCL